MAMKKEFEELENEINLIIFCFKCLWCKFIVKIKI